MGASLVPLAAETTSATFGKVISLGGTPSDIVLDESRGRLYLVNANANRIDIYDYANQQNAGSISVGQRDTIGLLSGYKKGQARQICSCRLTIMMAPQTS
jgi:DNA-binding beta-propeller fold protein YncE